MTTLAVFMSLLWLTSVGAAREQIRKLFPFLPCSRGDAGQ
jgi:hypothetical protein